MDKFTLHKDQKSDKWRLEKEGSDRAIKLFDRKADAIKGGALANAIGKSGGSPLKGDCRQRPTNQPNQTY